MQYHLSTSLFSLIYGKHALLRGKKIQIKISLTRHKSQVDGFCGADLMSHKPSAVIFLWIMLRVLYTSTPEQTNIYLFVLVDLVAYKMNEYVYMHASDNKTKHHNKKNVLFLNYKYYQISLNTAFSLHFIF